MRRLTIVISALLLAAAGALLAPASTAQAVISSCSDFGGSVVRDGYLNLDVRYTVYRKGSYEQGTQKFCAQLRSAGPAYSMKITNRYWYLNSPGSCAASGASSVSATATRLAMTFPGGDNYVIFRAGTDHKRVHVGPYTGTPC